MEQLIVGLIIIALGIYVFKFYPFEKGNVMNLVMAALFIVVTVICKRFFTILVPLFGVESLKIGIEYIPLMIAGYLLKPSYAFLIGLCSDVIGLILVPTGFPFFGFTLTMILVCVIPSLVRVHLKDIDGKKIRISVISLISLLGIGASFYIYTLDQVSISQETFVLSTQDKIALIALCLVLVCVFIALIQFLKKKIREEEANAFSTWILCVVLVEIIATLFLTPLWLDMMYGIPFIVSLCIRVIKECAVLPIEIFVGYTVLKMMKRVFSRYFQA